MKVRLSKDSNKDKAKEVSLLYEPRKSYDGIDYIKRSQRRYTKKNYDGITRRNTYEARFIVKRDTKQCIARRIQVRSYLVKEIQEEF